MLVYGIIISAIATGSNVSAKTNTSEIKAFSRSQLYNLMLRVRVTQHLISASNSAIEMNALLLKEANKKYQGDCAFKIPYNLSACQENATIVMPCHKPTIRRFSFSISFIYVRDIVIEKDFLLYVLSFLLR